MSNFDREPDMKVPGSSPLMAHSHPPEATLALHSPSPAHLLADQAFSRAAGAALIPGNSVRLLKDATENYPAWFAAIQSATRTIHFESYIIQEDEVGFRFADLFIRKQQEGVQVRLLYDWLGALGKTGQGFWQSLRDAGIEVRCVNPLQLTSPFGWINRDHRKMLTIDGTIGFVSGLCIGKMWEGDPQRNIAPWRDTGIEIRGPAIADLERAFAQVWSLCGSPLPPSATVNQENVMPAGDIALRVIASEPNVAGVYRLDTLIAAGARHSLWLTDAYFVGMPTYVQGLIAAARDGVDVRMLVPGSSDIALVRALSRAGYRPLLEGGVRVFEWNGPMLHAKTAVADGLWARVGSTNLNPASWLGNWELDVAIENADFAEKMEAMFLEDLGHATEIVLSTRHRIYSAVPQEREVAAVRRRQASAGRAVAGALRLSHVVGAAITNRRALGPAEAKVLVYGAVVLFVLALSAVLRPEVITIPLAVAGIWAGIIFLGRAYALRYRKSRRG